MICALERVRDVRCLELVYHLAPQSIECLDRSSRVPNVPRGGTDDIRFVDRDACLSIARTSANVFVGCRRQRWASAVLILY